jgi:hypothetical protein
MYPRIIMVSKMQMAVQNFQNLVSLVGNVPEKLQCVLPVLVHERITIHSSGKAIESEQYSWMRVVLLSIDILQRR